jgi:hypothetical protein
MSAQVLEDVCWHTGRVYSSNWPMTAVFKIRQATALYSVAMMYLSCLSQQFNFYPTWDGCNNSIAHAGRFCFPFFVYNNPLPFFFNDAPGAFPKKNGEI